MAVKMTARQAAALTGEKPPRQRRKAAPKAPRQASASERAFDTIWGRLAPSWAPAPVSELIFAPPRRWRFDRAWPALLVAVEIDGGTWSGGRHTRGAGFAADCEKLNRAAVLGWAVLRYTTDMLHADPDLVIGQVVELLRSRSAMLIAAD
jgi:hypothetical protein